MNTENRIPNPEPPEVAGAINDHEGMMPQVGDADLNRFVDDAIKEYGHGNHLQAQDLLLLQGALGRQVRYRREHPDIYPNPGDVFGAEHISSGEVE